MPAFLCHLDNFAVVDEDKTASVLAGRHSIVWFSKQEQIHLSYLYELCKFFVFNRLHEEITVRPQLTNIRSLATRSLVGELNLLN